VSPLLVDRHKLLQILINLLSNAQHALAENCSCGEPDDSCAQGFQAPQW
jgi:C4-dicarboxylate-specific signal transduction histidine kinase